MNKDSTKRQSFTGHKRGNNSGGSYAHVVNGGSSVANPASLISPSPTLVLDETCVIERDFSKCVMGKVKDANSISNIQTFPYDERFCDVKPKYVVRIMGDSLHLKRRIKIEFVVPYLEQISRFSDTSRGGTIPLTVRNRIDWIDIEELPKTSFGENSAPAKLGHEAKLDKAHDFGEAIEVPGIDPSPQIDAEVDSGLGSKTKKEWIKELCNNYKLSFIAIQETKMEKMSHMDVKFMWGNSNYDFVYSDSLGNSGAVEHFFNNGAFAKGCNSSFIALIPKIMDAKLVTDFRPISLIGCVYKVVTKILANRLVMNKKAMFFKVDFAKAYDSVRWDYLIDVLEAFGFGMTWCQWIRGLCCFAKASVLVNGSPSREFQFQCGLKQGDPLAPLLFILVMESLHLSFSRVVEACENYKGVGVSRLDIEAAAASIGCSIMDNQFRYLGVMTKTLSIGGRLTLLKSVLGASPLYCMSIFKAPKGVLKEMESIHIWKGDITLRDKFPRIFALEMDKTITVAATMASLMDFSFRRPSSHDDGSKPSSDDGKKVDEDPRKDSESKDQKKEDNVNSTNNVNAAGTNEVNAVDGKTSIELPFDPNMPTLEDDRIFDFSSDDGAVADMNNLDTTIQVSPILTIRIHKDHPLNQVIGDLQSATQTRIMSKNLEKHGFDQILNHISSLEILIKQHNEKARTPITPVRLTFGEKVEGDKIKDKGKGSTEEVEEDLKKTYKEVLKSPFTRRIIEFSAPSHRMPDVLSCMVNLLITKF
ncbi:RNA-directed DNA polymerase, eukaryota [Tanacetum coccineum]